MSTLKLLVGLGNPGKQYSRNRHNVGHLFVDHFAEIYDLKFKIYKKTDSEIAKKTNLILAKTLVFMNSSGIAVLKLIRNYKLEIRNLYLAHDDLDLPLGEFKIQKGIGPKLHNGINSIEQSIGTSDFWRIRIGVDARDSENRVPGEDYVLQNFGKDEFEKLQPVFEKITKELNLDD